MHVWVRALGVRLQLYICASPCPYLCLHAAQMSPSHLLKNMTTVCLLLFFFRNEGSISLFFLVPFSLYPLAGPRLFCCPLGGEAMAPWGRQMPQRLQISISWMGHRAGAALTDLYHHNLHLAEGHKQTHKPPYNFNVSIRYKNIYKKFCKIIDFASCQQSSLSSKCQ